MDGFLDKAISINNIEVIHNDCEAQFCFLYVINRNMYYIENLCDGRASATNIQDMFIISNFMAAHNSFQSAIILLERGLQDDALALFRGIFERLVHIKCAKKPTLFDKLELNSITDSLNTIRKVKQQDDEYRTDSLEKLNAMENRLMQKGQVQLNRINGNSKKLYTGRNEYKLDYLAKAVDMWNYYLYMYPILCKKIHSNMNDVIGKIEITEAERYILDQNPKYSDNYYYTQTLADMAVQLIGELDDYFRLGLKEKVDSLSEQEKCIWDKLF